MTHTRVFINILDGIVFAGRRIERDENYNQIIIFIVLIRLNYE